jgi:UDP-N-acetylenolpyruvoylglucosamine reductase
VADVRRAVLAIRRAKGMVLDPSDTDTRSVGSFFMNPSCRLTRRNASRRSRVTAHLDLSWTRRA